MGKLTNARHEKFIQNVVKGMSQRQAYKDAFNVNYSDDAIDNNASKLFKRDEVKTRYNELLQELEDKSIMSAKERMIWLTGVITGVIKESEIKEAYISDKMKAIDILNKMSGEYVNKIEANVGVSYEDALKEVEADEEY